MKIPKLYIGTAGWSYKDWVPSFYPKTQSANFDWLQFYSQYFNMVEVNASYYTYLNPKVVEAWLRKTDVSRRRVAETEEGNDFQFTIKLHQDFTHKRKFTNAQTRAVQDNLDILKQAERLGGLLIQFPYSFDFNDANVEYLRQLIEKFDGYEKFVEVRHKSWNNKKAKTITFCTIDQPQIGEAIEFNPIVGNDTAYIRFHGRNEEAWRKSLSNFGKKQTYEQQSARYKYLYSSGELAEIDQKLKEIFDKVKKIFVVMNNHPNGDAVANAFDLLHLLKDRAKIKMPVTIIKAYPKLKEFGVN